MIPSRPVAVISRREVVAETSWGCAFGDGYGLVQDPDCSGSRSNVSLVLATSGTNCSRYRTLLHLNILAMTTAPAPGLAALKHALPFPLDSVQPFRYINKCRGLVYHPGHRLLHVAAEVPVAFETKCVRECLYFWAVPNFSWLSKHSKQNGHGNIC